MRIDLRAVGWGQSHSASLRIVAVNNPIVYSNNPLAEGDLVGREVDLLPPSSLIEFDVWNLAVSLEESIPWDTCRSLGVGTDCLSSTGAIMAQVEG